MDARLEDNKAEFIISRQISKTKIILGLCISFICASYGYYYYEYKYLPKQEIKTILAEDASTRIKPEKPGGALVPNTDKLLYDNLKSGKNVENSISIMPEPEEPIQIIQKENPLESNNKIDDIILNILSQGEKKQEEVNQNNEEEISSTTEKLSEEEMVKETPSATKTLNIVPVEESIKHNKKKKPQTQEKTYYRLQLASVRTEANAISEWNRLKKLYPKQLGPLNHKIEKVTVENKGVFYRLLIGSFSNFSKAKGLCKKLNHTHQNCTIVNN